MKKLIQPELSKFTTEDENFYLLSNAELMVIYDALCTKEKVGGLSQVGIELQESVGKILDNEGILNHGT